MGLTTGGSVGVVVGNSNVVVGGTCVVGTALGVEADEGILGLHATSKDRINETMAIFK